MSRFDATKTALLFWSAFLSANMLLSQKTIETTPFSAWFEALPNDSGITLRARFKSEKTFPLFLFWRINQWESPSKRSRENGSFMVLPNDSALVWEAFFNKKIWPDGRSISLYVLDGDQIIARAAFQKSDFETALSPKIKPAPPAEPIEKKPLLAADDFALDLGGFVINEMRTRPGRELFQRFMERWQPPPSAESGAWWIAFRELPSQGRSSVLSVSLNNKELFQRFVPPQAAAQTELAQAIAAYLASLIGQGNFEGTLSDDDLSGTFIE